MFNLNPFILRKFAEARQRELLKEPKIERLLGRDHMGRLGLQDRFLLNVGDFLISFGQ
jgi:hypothetical protein